MGSPEIPEHIDNCLNHCPRSSVFHTPKEVAKFCIEKKCGGPIVQERIVDISEAGSDEDTATTFVKVCGSDLSSRTHEGYRPEEYTESHGDDDVNIADDETVLVHEFTQEEIRRKTGLEKPFRLR